jgi:Ribbon-helix-helix protein, copG family
MTCRAFADELERAADTIADVSRADLQILLRLAAFRLKITEGLAVDPDIDEAVELLAAELKQSRAEVLRTIVRDWLISDGRLPADPR